MKPAKKPGVTAAELRALAEAAFSAKAAAPAANLKVPTPEDARALLYELQVHQIELEMQNEELRGAQMGLEASHARYVDVYDFAPVGYRTVSETGLILEANLTLASLIGVARSTLATKLFSHYILREDQDAFCLLIKNMLAANAAATSPAASLPLPAVELRLVKSDGTGCWIRLLARVAADEQGEKNLRFAVTDITARKEADGARARSEENARQRLSEVEQIDAYSPIGMFTLDRDYRFLRINENIAEINGLSVADHAGKTLDEIVPDLTGFLKEAYRPIFERGEPVLNVEIHGKTPKGPDDERDWIGNYFLLKSATGEVIGLMGAVLEITERKHAEASLRASDRRFSDLVYSTDGIVWEADATTFGFISVSSNAERLLGYPVSNWLQPGFWAEHIHPDDRSAADEYCAACTDRAEDHDFEYRFTAADGRIVWLRDIVRVVTENNKPRWRRGLIVDITESKKVQQQLTQFQYTLDQALDCIFIFNPGTLASST